MAAAPKSLQALIRRALRRTSSSSPSPPASSCNAALQRQVYLAAVEQLLGIRFATAPQAAVFSQVLVNDCHLPSLRVQVCYDLAASTWRLMRIAWTRMTFAIEHFEEFAGFHALPITPFIEQASEFLTGDPPGWIGHG